MAGDDSFDLVSGQYATMPTLIPDGVLLALNDTKYIDFSNPWWARGLVEETSINGKVYLASGEISISNIKELSCFFYNKRLADEYSIEDPYKLVASGRLTSCSSSPETSIPTLTTMGKSQLVICTESLSVPTTTSLRW